MAKKKQNENETTLVAFIRKSKEGGALKLSISVEAINALVEAGHTYTTTDKDGNEQTWVGIVSNMNGVNAVIAGSRPVTSANHVVWKND